MLRASIRKPSRLSSYHSKYIENGRCQWQTVSNGGRSIRNTRHFADQLKPAAKNSSSVVQPGSAKASAFQLPPTGQTTIRVESNSVAPTSPKSINQKPALDKSSHPPLDPTTVLSSSPPSPKPRRLLRKLFSSLILLGIFGYGGGIYISTINDNFHDFFTEYVPFGEEAVLYLEEREFRNRFPNHTKPVTREFGNLRTIPSQSGMSWRVAEEHKQGSTGRHIDATQPNVKPSDSTSTKVSIANETDKENSATNSIHASELPNPKAPSGNIELSVTSVPSITSKSAETAPFTAPEVDQPSKFPPEIRKLELIDVGDDDEPIQQELAKIVNSIIKDVNAHGSNVKLLGTIESAKNELSKFGTKVLALKEKALKDAEVKIQAEKDDFERAAKELIRRVEAEMQLQQSKWQEEYQNERQKIQEAFDKKLNLEMQRTNEINEQRLNNALVEKELEMRKKFTQEIKDRVEEERDSRLGKLTDLSKSVNELEKLTTDWNSVLDFNLKTQHLHVAVEAVRASLEKSEVPRPFVRELVALREIASDDPIVNAAIASINPISYQRGIPSSAQVIDRFRRVATEVRKTALVPENAGVASHASSYVLSKLLFKKKGVTSGDDVESVLTRAETFLEEGQLDAAAREVNGLKGWAKILSRDWLDEVRRVLEVRQALDIIATEARLKSLALE
ncbi:MICOS complex subunit [Podosphaera aphanis]|nr:MICOS complex subunit [Podosphaera aphanis]